MKFLSPVYSQVSGSIAGLTYAHNRGGLYSRARATPTNPSTAPQQSVRNALATLASQWDQLSSVDQATWINLAVTLPVMGKLGQPIHLSGQQWFQKVNVTRIYIGESLVTTYVGGFVFASISTADAAPGAAPSSNFTVNFGTGTFDSWNTTGGVLAVYMSRAQNAGINFFKGPFQFLGKIAAGTASPVVLAAPFPNSVAGQKFFFRFRAQDPSGMPTTDIYSSVITT